MNEPFFTVLITAHKPERKYFLIQAIDSVLKQDFTGNYEILVVKSYSEDDIDGFLKNKGIVNITINETYSGPKMALGIQKSKGKYIAFLDDDDLFEKNKLSRVFQELVANPKIGLIKHKTKYINASGELLNVLSNRVDELFDRDRYFSSKEQFIRYQELMMIFSRSSSMVIKTDILKTNIEMLADILVSPDLYIFSSFLLSNYVAKTLSKELGVYRIHNSVSNILTGNLEKRRSTVHLMKSDQEVVASLFRSRNRVDLYKKQISISARFRLWCALLDFESSGTIDKFRFTDVGYALFGQPTFMTIKDALKSIFPLFRKLINE